MNRAGDEERSTGASKASVQLDVDMGSPDVLSVAFPNDEFERVLSKLLDEVEAPEGYDAERVTQVFLSNRDKLTAPAPDPLSYLGMVGCAFYCFCTITGFIVVVSLLFRLLQPE